MSRFRETLAKAATDAQARFTLAKERAPFGVGVMVGFVAGFLVAWVF